MLPIPMNQMRPMTSSNTPAVSQPLPSRTAGRKLAVICHQGCFAFVVSSCSTRPAQAAGRGTYSWHSKMPAALLDIRGMTSQATAGKLGTQQVRAVAAGRAAPRTSQMSGAGESAQVEQPQSTGIRSRVCYAEGRCSRDAPLTGRSALGEIKIGREESDADSAFGPTAHVDH
jgi:hypothetical protein